MLCQVAMTCDFMGIYVSVSIRLTARHSDVLPAISWMDRSIHTVKQSLLRSMTIEDKEDSRIR